MQFRYWTLLLFVIVSSLAIYLPIAVYRSLKKPVDIVIDSYLVEAVVAGLVVCAGLVIVGYLVWIGASWLENGRLAAPMTWGAYWIAAVVSGFTSALGYYVWSLLVRHRLADFGRGFPFPFYYPGDCDPRYWWRMNILYDSVIAFMVLFPVFYLLVRGLTRPKPKRIRHNGSRFGAKPGFSTSTRWGE